MGRRYSKSKVMRRKRMGKRGNIGDLLYVAVFIFIFGFVSILAYTIWLDAEPKLNANLDSDVGLNATQKSGKAITNLDYVTMMLVVGLLMATMIGAYFIDTHPIFFVASFLLLILLLVLMPVLSNVFETFTDKPKVSTAAASFDITTSFFDDLPKYFMVMAALVLVAMFSKHRTSGGEI